MNIVFSYQNLCLPFEKNVIIFLFQTYVDYMSRLYEREIKDFFEVAKIKMAGTTKEAKGKFGKNCNSDFLLHRYEACSSFAVYVIKSVFFS